MRKSRFSEEQIIGILREQEAGAATAEVVASTGSAPRRSTMEIPLLAGSGFPRPAALGAGAREREAESAEAMLDNAALKDLVRKS